MLDAFGVLMLPKIAIVLIFVVMAVVLIVRPWGLLGPARDRSARRRAAPWRRERSRGGSGRVWLGRRVLVALVRRCRRCCRPSTSGSLVEMLAFALFAASLHLLMGGGGMVSFGHAAYFGLGAYGAALLMKLAGLPMPVAFVLAPVVAGAGRRACSASSACG